MMTGLTDQIRGHDQEIRASAFPLQENGPQLTFHVLIPEHLAERPATPCLARGEPAEVLAKERRPCQKLADQVSQFRRMVTFLPVGPAYMLQQASFQGRIDQSFMQPA